MFTDRRERRRLPAGPAIHSDDDADEFRPHRCEPRPGWHTEEACADMASAGIFFGGSPINAPITRGELARARAVCRTWPVARDLPGVGLSEPELYGVWAGTSGRQREPWLADTGLATSAQVMAWLDVLSRPDRPSFAIVTAVTTTLIGGPFDGQTTEKEPNQDGQIVMDSPARTEHHFYTGKGVYVGGSGPITATWTQG